jgi:hypothetical protein
MRGRREWHEKRFQKQQLVERFTNFFFFFWYECENGSVWGSVGRFWTDNGKIEIN